MLLLLFSFMASVRYLVGVIVLCNTDKFVCVFPSAFVTDLVVGAMAHVGLTTLTVWVKVTDPLGLGLTI